MVKSPAPPLQRRFKTVSIQTVLVVPFLLQVIGIVALVAYLSYRNGQQMLKDLAYQLTQEVAARVSDRLNAYLQTPHQLLTANRIDLEQGTFDPRDLDSFEARFQQQVQAFDWLSSIHFTNAQGEYTGLIHSDQNIHLAPNTLIRSELRGASPGTLESYQLDAQGHPLQRVHRLEKWDPRTRPWYQTAQQQQTSAWTPIFSWPGLPIASLTAVTPVRRHNEIVGVLGIDLQLSQINQFLQALDFSPSEQILIVERSGAIVATSTQEPSFIPAPDGQSLQRLQLMQSQDPVIQALAKYLGATWGDLHQIRQAQMVTFAGDRSSAPGLWQDPRYFAQIVPYQDDYGLDWLVIVIIPAKDLTVRLQENIRQTIIWTGFSLLGAIALGVLTTRWIAHPILGLRDSANRMAAGECDLNIPKTSITELRQLAFSFEEMASQVQQSLAEMQALNANLRESRGNLEKFLDGVPVGVSIHQADGTITYLNQAARHLLGVEELSQVPHLDLAIAYPVYQAGMDQPYPNDLFPVLRALRGESAIAEDIVIQRGDTRINLEVRATPIYSQEGQISHAIVTLQDITTRQAAARVLADYNQELTDQVQRRTLALEQESQERQQIAATLRAILQAIPDLLLRLRIDGTYIERLSDGEVQMLPGSLNMTGKSLFEILPEAIAHHRLTLIQRAITTGILQIDEYQVVVNGEDRDEESRIVKIADNEVLVIVRDISDRKRAERALQQSEAHNRAIITAIPDLMFRLSREGVYLGYVKTDALIDLIPEDLNPVGRHISEYVPSEIMERHLYHIEFALKTGRLQIYEQENWIGEQLQYEEVRVIPCGDHEALFLIRDIGDRKRAEKELRLANLRLAQLAQTDGLTQLANRRHFDDYLHQEWQTLTQSQEPLSLILFDVDYFKLYNDHYGHQAGDQCLMAIAAAARQIIRYPTDLVARYGGEEFAIVLPHTDVSGVFSVMERLRESIQDLKIPHAWSDVSGFITVSMGSSSQIPSLQSSPERLVTQADQALYLAKQQGRDRAIQFPSILRPT